MRDFKLATLIDNKGFEDELSTGVRGVVECTVTIPDEGSYSYFKPFGSKIMYITLKDRFRIEENTMWFETLEDVKTYFNEYRAGNDGSKNINYSVTAKKAFVEFMQRKEISVANCARAAGVSTFSIKHWKEQYREGLYDNLDAVTKVSMKTKKTHSSALATLEAEKKRIEDESKLQLAQIAAQIAAIKTLESNGFSISKL